MPRMVRLLALLPALLLPLGLSAGCTRQCFMDRKDFYNSHHLPPHLDKDIHAGVAPLIPVMPAPPTLAHPKRPPRYLTLQEAIAIALENGSPSTRVGAGQGIPDDTLATFQQLRFGLEAATERMRVLSFNPAIAAALLEGNLARFDAVWVTSMNWSATDNLQQGLTSFQNGQRAAFESVLAKPLPTGGLATVSFGTEYQLLNNPPTGIFGVVNPLYTTRLRFGFEQPLWRDYGVEVNQLLRSFPRAVSNAIPQQAASFAAFRPQTDVAPQGILISRLIFDASRTEFERQVHGMVLNVEVAYWKLYQAYGRLYSNEEVLLLAHRAWMINKLKLDAGTIGPEVYAPTRAQYEEFRGERIRALGNVLDAERRLRAILGVVEDGTRLVPITPPTLAPYSPDWSAAVHDCLTRRPELMLARDNLRDAQFNVLERMNLLKPDLRFFGQYSPAGFGSRLDGNGTFTDGTGTERTDNANRALAGLHFNDWTIGLQLGVPLGFRLENAQVRAARMRLAQSYLFLKDQEERATRVLQEQYQKLNEYYDLIVAARQERKAYADAVDARFKAFTAGKLTADALLEVQRRLAFAQVKEYEAIAEYNNTLARFEWAKGTILAHDNILIAEGDLPVCAQVRAVEHERERSKAIALCERPQPMQHPGMLAGHVEDYDPNMRVTEEELAKFEAKLKSRTAPQDAPSGGKAPSQVAPPPLLPTADGEKRTPTIIPAPAGLLNDLPWHRARTPANNAIELRPARDANPPAAPSELPDVFQRLPLGPTSAAPSEPLPVVWLRVDDGAVAEQLQRVGG